MLSEINWLQKEKYLHEVPRSVKSQRHKIKWWLPRAWGGENWTLLNGYIVSVLQNEKISVDLLHSNMNVLHTFKTGQGGQFYVMFTQLKKTFIIFTI